MHIQACACIVLSKDSLTVTGMYKVQWFLFRSELVHSFPENRMSLESSFESCWDSDEGRGHVRLWSFLPVFCYGDKQMHKEVVKQTGMMQNVCACLLLEWSLSFWLTLDFYTLPSQGTLFLNTHWSLRVSC